MGVIGCSQPQQNIEHHRSAIYFSHMLSVFSYPSQIQTSTKAKDNNFILQLQSIPSNYVDLLLYLNNNDKKYTDDIFPPLLEWERIPTFSEIGKIKQHPNRKSKFVQVLQQILTKYPKLWQEIKPKYIKKIGFALVELYINGIKQLIVVDDYIPINNYLPISVQFLIFEKSFAKVLGSYDWIQQFTNGDIFQQITGIPYSPLTHQNKENNITKCLHIVSRQQRPNTSNEALAQYKKYQNFKDAIGYDQLIYDHSNEVSVIGYRSDNIISSIKVNFSEEIFPQAFYKFQLLTKTIISLRISRLNPKYYHFKKTYINAKILMEMYYQSNEKQKFIKYLTKRQICYRVDHHLYIQNVFTCLEKGTYILYLRGIEQLDEISLIGYCNQKIKFKQLNNIQKIYRQVIEPLNEIQLQSKNNKKHRSEVINENIMAVIYNVKNRYLLKLTRKNKNGKSKIIVKIHNKQFLFEDLSLSKEKQIQLQQQNNYSSILSILSLSQNIFGFQDIQFIIKQDQ